MQISELNGLLGSIQTYFSISEINTAFTNLQQSVNVTASTNELLRRKRSGIVTALTTVKGSINKILTLPLSDEERSFLTNAGFFDVFETKWIDSAIKTPSSILDNETLKELNNIVKSGLNWINTINSQKTSFEMYKVPLNRREPRENIITIIFDKEVSITNFEEAKNEMTSWRDITRGYAMLLSTSLEDFPIDGISTNSPTKFEVVVGAIALLTAFVEISTKVIEMQISLIERETKIEELRQNKFGDNKELVALQNEMREILIKQKEEEFEKKSGVIVNEAAIKYGKENDNEVKGNLKQAITNQYNFYINGGETTVYIGQEDGNTVHVEKFEKAKAELTALKDSSVFKKALPEKGVSE